MELRPVEEMDKITAPMRNEIQWTAEKAKEILRQFQSAETNISALDNLIAKVS